MRSKVKRLLEGAHDQQPLLKFIDEAMVVADRKRVLEVQCMLCTLYVMYTVCCAAEGAFIIKLYFKKLLVHTII